MNLVAQALPLFVASAALAVLIWGYRLHRQGADTHGQRLADRFLLVLGLAAALAYPNVGKFHFDNFVHTWDTYHYYMGAKYFRELGYVGLYDCAVVAESELAQTPREVASIGRRAITDLRTNVLNRASEVLKDPQTCKASFSDARWQQFKADLSFFKPRVHPQRWLEMHQDHGFNGTPVWLLLGGLLANTGPATLERITALNLVDPLYLALTAALLWWAFGPRVFALGLIILGTNFPNRFYYTGGAFLRHDWLFYLVAVVCLLKKERFALAGAALAYASLLRLFPGLLLIGPLLAGIELYRRRGKVDPRFAKFMAGGAAASALLLASSWIFVGGIPTWERFAENTAKHAATPLNNHMGLRTVLSYRPDDIARKTRDATLIDPWSDWKARRLANWSELEPLFWLSLIGCCFAVQVAVRRTQGELWIAAALGAGMIAFAAELTCYYYCFLIALAPLHEERREVGVILVGLATVTQLIARQSLVELWFDEQYVLGSVATLAAVAGIWWMFGRTSREGDLVRQRAVPPGSGS